MAVIQEGQGYVWANRESEGKRMSGGRENETPDGKPS